MGMRFAPTWLGYVSPPSPASHDHFNHWTERQIGRQADRMVTGSVILVIQIDLVLVFIQFFSARFSFYLVLSYYIQFLFSFSFIKDLVFIQFQFKFFLHYQFQFNKFCSFQFQFQFQLLKYPWLQVTCPKGHLSEMQLCRFRKMTLNLTLTLVLALTLCLYVSDK